MTLDELNRCEVGAAEQVLRQPAHAYTKLLLEAVPQVPA